MPITVGVAGTITPPIDSVLKHAARNEADGFDSLWWPDHLMGWHPESIWTPDLSSHAAAQPNPHTFLDPVAAISAVAGVTSTVGLGVSVTEAVRNHPAQIARAWLSLDHITKGRAILGLGAGEGENIEPYGIGFEKPVGRLEDAIRVIRLLWENDDPVDYDGPFFRLRRAVLGMRPHEPGVYPPVWVAAHGPRMCRITGELADGWLPMQLDVEEYALRLSEVRAAASKAGRDALAITPGLWNYIVVAPDHERSHRALEHPWVKGLCLALPDDFYRARGFVHPLGSGFHGLTRYVPTSLHRERALELIGSVPFEVVHDSTFHGTPADVAAEVGRYAAVGLRHVTLTNITFLGDPGLLRPSFALMCDTKDEIKRLPEPASS